MNSGGLIPSRRQLGAPDALTEQSLTLLDSQRIRHLNFPESHNEHEISLSLDHAPRGGRTLSIVDGQENVPSAGTSQSGDPQINPIYQERFINLQVVAQTSQTPFVNRASLPNFLSERDLPAHQ